VADDLEIRAGDDERNATIERLAEHYRAGRLTADELEERTSAAQVALTRGDLAALEADLPAPSAPAAPGRSRDDAGDDEGSLADSLKVYAVVITFLWIIWGATGAGYPWPIWPMLGWGLGLALGAVGRRSHRRGLPAAPPPPGLPPMPHDRPRERRDERRRSRAERRRR
jgi:hypothetical protein